MFSPGSFINITIDLNFAGINWGVLIKNIWYIQLLDMLNYPPDNFRVIIEIAGKLSETISYTSAHVHIGKK